MAIKITSKGQRVYEFDFVPAFLIPLDEENGHGAKDHYTIADENGVRAPIEFEFQGERYANYGFAFCGVATESGFVSAITTNISVVATLANMFELNNAKDGFDPWGADAFARQGKKFRMFTVQEAQKFMAEHAIPKDGYSLLRSEFV